MPTADQGLATLRDAHTTRLRATRDELEAMQPLIRFNLFAAADLQRLIHLAHLESGAAASFGFAELGEVAQEVEEELRQTDRPEAAAAGVERFLAAVESALGHGAVHGSPTPLR